MEQFMAMPCLGTSGRGKLTAHQDLKKSNYHNQFSILVTVSIAGAIQVLCESFGHA